MIFFFSPPPGPPLFGWLHEEPKPFDYRKSSFPNLMHRGFSYVEACLYLGTASLGPSTLRFFLSIGYRVVPPVTDFFFQWACFKILSRIWCGPKHIPPNSVDLSAYIEETNHSLLGLVTA